MTDKAQERVKDPYLGTCVGWRYGSPCGSPVVAKWDFCQECLDSGEAEDNFGRCYHCRDFGDHAACIGVPCNCPCPPPDQIEREREREVVLAKLTPHERAVLGY